MRDRARRGEAARAFRSRDRFAWPLAVALAVLGGFLLVRYDPLGLVGPCPLRALTGIPCPTCGGTTVVRNLASGDLGAAFLANPLVMLAIVAAIGAAVVVPLVGRRGGSLRLAGRSRRVAIAGLVVAVLANWVYLLLAATP